MINFCFGEKVSYGCPTEQFSFQKINKISSVGSVEIYKFIIVMLQLWHPFTGASENLGIQLRGVLDSAWTEFSNLYALKHGRKKGKKNRKIPKFSIFLGHPMFSTSVGTSQIKFWLFENKFWIPDTQIFRINFRFGE